MTHDSVQAWLNRYVAAWRTYDADQIGALFSADARYFYYPFDEQDPVRGRAAIVATWLEDPDVAGSWDAHYVPITVKGDVGVAQGRTRYFRADGTLDREFANLFVVHVDAAGQCTQFTEWYMQHPTS